MAKILIVEDERQLADLVRYHLELERHDVQCVENGHEGWSRIRSYRYDLIILDWQLPGRSGIDICRDMRAGGNSTPVLMITGKVTIDY